jgi:uncharacterized protein YcgL (UPF0745 family)
MKKYKTITIEKYNWSGSEILIVDFQTKEEKVLKDTDLKSVINDLNQDGYVLCGINGREYYMTKEISG